MPRQTFSNLKSDKYLSVCCFSSHFMALWFWFHTDCSKTPGFLIQVRFRIFLSNGPEAGVCRARLEMVAREMQELTCCSCLSGDRSGSSTLLCLVIGWEEPVGSMTLTRMLQCIQRCIVLLGKIKVYKTLAKSYSVNREAKKKILKRELKKIVYYRLTSLEISSGNRSVPSIMDYYQ